MLSEDDGTWFGRREMLGGIYKEGEWRETRNDFNSTSGVEPKVTEIVYEIFGASGTSAYNCRL